MHRARWRKHGSFEDPTPSPTERFWAKVQKSEGCWLWTASRDDRGYGVVHWAGRSQKAHRVSYELSIGPIPEGLTLDHLCRTLACVRPDHLEPVTSRENILRPTSMAMGARNARKQSCPRGHAYDYVHPLTGYRACNTCHAERARERRRR